MTAADSTNGRARWLSWLFLLAGLLATGIAYERVNHLVQQEVSAQLDARAKEAKFSVERQVSAYTEVLRGLQAQFVADANLSRATFHKVAASLHLESRLPGIQAVGFSPRVAPQERAAFAEALKGVAGSAGVASSSWTTASMPAAGASFIVQFIEPLEKNQGGFGYDQLMEPKRRIAIEKARDTGELASSGRVRLFIEPGNVDGLVFFLPVYRGGDVPASLAARRERIVGVVFLAVRVDEVLRSVFGPELLNTLDIEIYDMNGNETASTLLDGRNLIFDSGAYQGARRLHAPELIRPLSRSMQLPFSGSTWQLEVTALPNFVGRSQSWLPYIAALASSLLSLMVFFIMRYLDLTRHKSDARAEKAEHSLNSRERQLAKITGSIDAVLWTFNLLDRKIEYVSPAVERVYGRPADAFYANPMLWTDCIHLADRKQAIDTFKTIEQTGREVLQLRIIRPDGEVRWIRYEAHFIAADSAGAGRIDAVCNDITQQHLLEESQHRHIRALRAIHQCEERIAAAEAEDALLQGICDIAVRAGYRMAWAGMVRTDGGGIALAGIAGDHQDYLASIETALAAGGDGMATIGEALRSNRPVVANDFSHDPRLAPWRQEAMRCGFNSKIALPLVGAQSLIGIVNVYASEENAFDAEEMELLAGLAQRVAIAIESLRNRVQRQAAEGALRLRQRAIEASANAIIITSATRPGYPVEYVNPAFERMTGYSFAEMAGQSLALLHRDDVDQPGLAEIRAVTQERRSGYARLRNYRKDGTLFWSEVYIAPVKDEAGVVTHFVAAKYDVTETKRYQDELEFQASHDALTGLANRSLLKDRLVQAIAHAGRYGEVFWVVFIDLDRFKFVNDSLGHSTGDTVLKEVASRLKGALRDTDTVARNGGDEFVLILSGHHGECQRAATVQRVMEAISRPLSIDDREFYVGCSAGIAVYPDDGKDADALIKHADVAMYRAKECGRNNFQFYTADMNEEALERLHLESDLRHAIDRNELVLHYQPQVCLRTGRIVGIEALVRWQHPRLGLVAPGRFIGLAEETGLIVPIGKWILRTACRQTKLWHLAGLGDLRVAVNLSARQFAEKDLGQSIMAVLDEAGLESRHLEIELTESLVMKNVEYTIGVLRELKARGLQLSVDDFGTGYSSLSYLKRFPIDVLKIDQSFVRDIANSPDDAAIVRSIISLAHSLRLHVIAEGVETPEQLAYLRHHRCEQMQGYFFSRPLPAPQLEAMLREGKSLDAEHLLDPPASEFAAPALCQ